MALMAEKARLAALLPEGWSRDMTTFLSLSQEVNRWVPGWMCAPRPQTDTTERTDNLADAA